MALEEEGPITTFVNEVKIKFDVGKLCEILRIENVGMNIYESKSWLKVVGFTLAKTVQRMCVFPFSNVTTQTPAHSLLLSVGYCNT